MELNLNFGVEKNQLDANILYDLIVIGGGPAGISAAIYSKRKGLEVGLIGENIGGQVNDTSSVENYIGFSYITGEDLSDSFSKHLNELDIDILTEERVKSIKKEDSIFEIQVSNYTTYKAKTALIATGSKPRKLGVIGEEKFIGKGVTYCGICDGPLFKNKTLVISGGGNSAVEAAIDLSKIAKHVHLVHRSKLRADSILTDKLNNINNISILLETEIKEILGMDKVERLLVYDKVIKKEKFINTDGILIEIGHLPNIDFEFFAKKNNRNEVIVNEHNQTSVEGLFAAGDVTDIKFKQIIISAGDGAKAALSVNEFIMKGE